MSFNHLGIVDANYKFIWAECGVNGKISDGGVWIDSPFQKMVNGLENILNIPNNYVFIADDAFPLKKNLLKPFRGSSTPEQEVFNYRLSRARRCVENAFGNLNY